MPCFVQTQILPVLTLVHQAFNTSSPTEWYAPHHHCQLPSIICHLFCVSLKLTITRSVSQSCNESMWLDRVTHLPVIFPYVFAEIWNRVTNRVSSFAAPPLQTHTDPKRGPWRFSCPAAFKASLDRLGCSWKTLFHRSRGQTHLRGKKKGERKSSGMSGHWLTTSSTFSLPQIMLTPFEQFWRQ